MSESQESQGQDADDGFGSEEWFTSFEKWKNLNDRIVKRLRDNKYYRFIPGFGREYCRVVWTKNPDSREVTGKVVETKWEGSKQNLDDLRMFNCWNGSYDASVAIQVISLFLDSKSNGGGLGGSVSVKALEDYAKSMEPLRTAYDTDLYIYYELLAPLQFMSGLNADPRNFVPFLPR